MRNAEREVFLFRRRLVVAGAPRAAGVRRPVRALRVPAGLPARALSNARRVESRRHRSDRSEPRRHHRSQRHRARAKLLGVHARAHARQDQESRGDHRRAGDHRRHPAARPQALPQAPRRIEEFREHAAAHAPVRRGGRALRGQSLSVSRRRHQGAAVPPVPVRRGRLARDRLHRAASPTRTSSVSPAGRRSANYKGSDYIGKVGVELSYERELHGTTGVEEVEVDAGGRAVRTLSRTPPVSGNNLRLSLDIKLQEAAELAFGDRRGALVAIEPATGDILAFVSKPGYRPEPLRRGHRHGELGRAQRFARQAAAQSPAARRLSAGVDDQAVPRARSR